MKDRFDRVNDKAQAIRSLDKLKMAQFLNDVSNNTCKYPNGVNEWIDWLKKESGDDVLDL